MSAQDVGLRFFCYIIFASVVFLADRAAAYDPNFTPAQPRFENVALEAGVEHVYGGSWEHFTGGGVAAFDCDNDADPDLFFAGGGNPAQLFRNDSQRGNGLSFTPLGDAAPHDLAVTGAYPLDFNGDGNMDLAVLRIGENKLYLGLGDCRFEAANAKLHFNGGGEWTTAFSATWEGDNRMPTLAFGNYVNRAVWAAIHTAFGVDDQNRKSSLNTCLDNYLVRPAGVSADRFAAPLTLSPGFCALSILFSDWNRSGKRDLRISNDQYYYLPPGEEQLWHLAPEPALYQPEEGWQTVNIWGMGIATHDITGDGYPEYFLTNMMANNLATLGDDPSVGPRFVNIAGAAGVVAPRPYTGGDQDKVSTAWHAQFADLNNDGLVDLFIAKGNVDEMEEGAIEDPNNLLMRRPDGSFREAGQSAGVGNMERSRGAALIDLDLDGRLDIVVVNRRANAEILHNQSDESGAWLQVALRQKGGNVNAVGAWIEVRAEDEMWRQEVVIGGGHASGQSGWHHFGLGGEDEAEIRVQWPDGMWSAWQPAGSNRFITLSRDGYAVSTHFGLPGNS